MREHFEARDWDGAGRVGRLDVPRAGVTVETPALLPVVNPNIQTLEPRRMREEFGAQILITNSYIIRSSDGLRERALDEGLHDLLEFDGAIMTDSGSFQLAEYGEIDVTTEEILAFQHEIGSDIGTPVDIPTPPDASRADAEADLETTQERLGVAADVDVGEMLVNAPVQGATFPDLREAAGRHAAGTDLDVFPIGAVVPLLNEYRYGDMVDVIAASKRGLDQDCPVHLFGAGHPMMFALAAAMGCDLFDSAAYALYARDDRYLTVRGTRHLEELAHLPCPCPVCTTHTPGSLRELGDRERGDELAAHNLHVSFAEMRRVRQAIRTGSLFELVESRARAHPAMLDGYRAALDHAAQLERTDAASKDTFFYLSSESARRPEVHRHHERLGRIAPGASGDTGTPGTDDDPEILLTEGDNDDAYDESWPVEPPFGPFPRDLRNTYPLTAELPDRLDVDAYEAAADGVAALVAESTASFTLAHRNWPTSALDRVPESVSLVNLHGDRPGR